MSVPNEECAVHLIRTASKKKKKPEIDMDNLTPLAPCAVHQMRTKALEEGQASLREQMEGFHKILVETRDVVHTIKDAVVGNETFGITGLVKDTKSLQDRVARVEEMKRYFIVVISVVSILSTWFAGEIKDVLSKKLKPSIQVSLQQEVDRNETIQ